MNIRNDTLVFEFRFKPESESMIQNRLSGSVGKGNEPLRISGMVGFFQSLLETDALVPKHNFNSWPISSSVVLDDPSGVFPCDHASRQESIGKVSRVLDRLDLDESIARVPSPSEISSLLERWRKQLPEGALAGTYSTRSYVGLAHHQKPKSRVSARVSITSAEIDAIQIARQGRCGFFPHDPLTVLLGIYAACSPMPFSKEIPPHAEIRYSSESVSMIQDGIIRYAIGTYCFSDTLEILAKALLVRINDRKR